MNLNSMTKVNYNDPLGGLGKKVEAKAAIETKENWIPCADNPLMERNTVSGKIRTALALPGTVTASPEQGKFNGQMKDLDRFFKEFAGEIDPEEGTVEAEVDPANDFGGLSILTMAELDPGAIEPLDSADYPALQILDENHVPTGVNLNVYGKPIMVSNVPIAEKAIGGLSYETKVTSPAAGAFTVTVPNSSYRFKDMMVVSSDKTMTGEIPKLIPELKKL